jgi:Protein of unknown function (DUF1275)
LNGGAAVAAMAFQTALMRESLTGSYPTTVMTGNFAQLVMEVVDHACNKLMQRASGRLVASRSRLAQLAGALVAFTSAAVLGAWLSHVAGSLSVALPALVTAALALRAWRADRAQLAAGLGSASSPPFTDDEIWPDSLAPQALSQPYTEPESGTRIKAERVFRAPDEAPVKRSMSGTHLTLRSRKDE